MKKQFKCVVEPTQMSRQSGVSIVEILVAVLILSVGSLGIVSLQLAGMKYSAGAYARTQIVILSDDIVNRMKANRDFALDFDADGDIGTDFPYEVANFTGAIPFVSCATQNCDLDEIVDQDLASWLNEVARVLPSGQARLTSLDTTSTNQFGDSSIEDRQFLIEFQWRQFGNTTSPDASDDDDIQTAQFRVSL